MEGRKPAAEQGRPVAQRDQPKARLHSAHHDEALAAVAGQIREQTSRAIQLLERSRQLRYELSCALQPARVPGFVPTNWSRAPANSTWRPKSPPLAILGRNRPSAPVRVWCCCRAGGDGPLPYIKMIA